ncbi:MAG: beta-ketoacyl-ACP synthase II [Planctomycetes bacterium]|nr:beta-ketoacyl-ACP synthase II [Planctomycetota bacterium]
MKQPDYPRRVVVTGLGPVTPVGIGKDETWQALMDGKCGAGEITLLDHSDFSVHFACEVKNFDPCEWMDARETKRVDRFVHFAMASARLAMDDSKLDMSKEDATRCGIVYGCGIGGVLSTQDIFEKYQEKGAKRISPFTVPLLMTNCASGMMAIDHGFKGLNYSPVTACATGSHSIGLALRHIQWGEAEVCMAGGTEAGISILGLGGFSNMKALSTRNDDPMTASRPFDKDRNGFVMGEGAGCVILEELEHAKARGAHIYAELLGYGMTDDAYHITAPDETADGGARCIRMAVENSRLKPEDIDYINAHGTSTPYNDKTETKAIKLALGEDVARKVAISSTKGNTGHMLGAAGGVEAIFAIQAIEKGIVPPTINHFTPDPECDLDYVPNKPREMEVNYVLSNSLGFGGHNCTVCFGKYKD